MTMDDEMFRAREIEIRSDDDRNVDGETSSSDSEGGIPRERPTHDQINVKIRDGALDEDSRMGRVYRATAKKNIASLPEKKRKAARRAFGLWDQCTENSWDRRRWTQPQPHTVRQSGNSGPTEPAVRHPPTKRHSI